MSACLACFEPVETGLYHSSCCHKVFGTPQPPVCDLSLDALPHWALQELGAHHALTGAQRKISAHWLSAHCGGSNGGRFILKPASPEFPHMPLNEALTMAMARKYGIATAPSALLLLADNSLAYITQRFDRTPRLAKIHCEDMAQLSGTLTEDKYRGSIEQVGAIIQRYSAQPGVDTARLFSLALFCFVTGNSDMHLKNFSLLQDKGRPVLSPAYDLLNVRYYMPADEDSALSINGKRRRLLHSDFVALARHLDVTDKYMNSALLKLTKWWSECQTIFESEPIPADFANAYRQSVEQRLKILG